MLDLFCSCSRNGYSKVSFLGQIGDNLFSTILHPLKSYISVNDKHISYNEKNTIVRNYNTTVLLKNIIGIYVQVQYRIPKFF